MKINLNENQQRAVETNSKHVRIIAGAGSGKTRVLTSRIVYLIQELGIMPGKILAITFTNKASNQMKERVKETLGDEGSAVHISTIHSLCIWILKEDIVAMDYPRNFSVLDGEDQKTILKEAYKELNIEVKNISYSNMLNYISNNKGADISVEQAYNLTHGDDNLLLKAKTYDFYVKRQENLYALDFDDLLLWTVRMFRKYPNILRKWQQRFQYILVDEFQDVDNVQYELVQQLGGKDNQVYVVGDPDQTIYTWRGANVQLIMDFEKDFDHCETIVLNENYRSTPTILKGSNCVIKNNKQRIAKELFSNQPDGDKILHYSALSEQLEGDWIAQQIMELHRNQKEEYQNIAILYRANYLSSSVEKALRDYRIPYIIYRGVRFFDRAEVKDILSYLRLMCIGDDLSFKRVINTPRRGIGEKSVDHIYQVALEKNISMFDCLTMDLGFSSRLTNILTEFRSLILSMKQKADSLDLTKVIEMVLDETGYRQMLENDKDMERLENIKELMNDVNNYVATNDSVSLEEYLQMVSLYSSDDNNQKDESVQLMTIHAAKGLEFNEVFICGLSEGIFPSMKSLMDGLKGLEEERRLAYVAFTRAKKKLFLSESHGYSYVTSGEKEPSRFIGEIDGDYIEHIRLKRNENEAFSHTNMMSSANNMVSSEARIIKNDLRAGDLITHTAFGEGVVIGVKGNMIDVAFNYPTGTKTLMKNHPAIKKVK